MLAHCYHILLNIENTIYINQTNLQLSDDTIHKQYIRKASFYTLKYNSLAKRLLIWYTKK
jgi:hypothetical protein